MSILFLKFIISKIAQYFNLPFGDLAQKLFSSKCTIVGYQGFKILCKLPIDFLCGVWYNRITPAWSGRGRAMEKGTNNFIYPQKIGGNQKFIRMWEG